MLICLKKSTQHFNYFRWKRTAIMWYSIEKHKSASKKQIFSLFCVISLINRYFNTLREVCPRRDRNFWSAVYVHGAAEPRAKLARNSRGGHKSAKSNHPLPTILSTILPLFHPRRKFSPSRSLHRGLFSSSLFFPPCSPCLDMSAGTELHSTPWYYDV